MARKINDETLKTLAEYCSEHVGFTNKELSEVFNMDYRTIKKMLSNPVYLAEYHRLCQERFGRFENLFVEKLIENVQKGDKTCIIWGLESLGYKPPEKIEVSSNDITVNIGG